MNKELEVALITTDQLRNEFDKIKELIKNELLKEIREDLCQLNWGLLSSFQVRIEVMKKVRY